MPTKQCPGCGVFIKSYLAYCEKCVGKVGYHDCGCSTCFEIVIGVPGELCDECKEAGCGEERCVGQPREECLVERCVCGGNIHKGECYCHEDEERVSL